MVSVRVGPDLAGVVLHGVDNATALLVPLLLDLARA
jgi:hypothetical protein